jgi:hypothetical protein
VVELNECVARAEPAVLTEIQISPSGCVPDEDANE